MFWYYFYDDDVTISKYECFLLPSELEELLDVLDALSDNSPSSFVTSPSFLQALQADWHYKQSARAMERRLYIHNYASKNVNYGKNDCSDYWF